MNIRQLQYFLSIVDYNSFSIAAEENYIAQSTISKHIAALEQELGVSLFDRSCRQVKLTESGEDFLSYARQFCNTYGNMISAMKTRTQESDHCVTIGLHCLATHYETLPALVEFQDKHPDIKVVTKYIPSWTIQESLGRSECDFGILYGEGIDLSKYAAHILTEDRLVLVVPDDHPLAQREHISITELSDVPMGLTRERTQMYHIVQRECKKYDVTPQLVFRDAFPEPTLSLLKIEKVGMLFLNQALRCYHLNGLKVLPLEEDILVPLVLIRYKKNRSSSADRKLLRFLKDYYTSDDTARDPAFTRLPPPSICFAPEPLEN